jgi:hypothetical protein
MDKWIQLGIIKPSKSPWAAPGFIFYQNGKPCMVQDYRKLNEIAISDEFPLLKQGLSTLDTLAGLTQVEVESKEREISSPDTSRIMAIHQNALWLQE